MKRRLHTIAHLRSAARRRLPRLAFDFMDGGAGSERALARNCEAFAKIRMLPRALVGCETRRRAVTIFGEAYAQPFGVAPIGLANLIWPGADEALAAAAAKAQTPYVLSTAGTTSIETIAKIAPRAWFQLYVGRDQAIVDDLIARADVAGAPVLVVTVDVPAPGKRVRDLVNKFSLPLRLGPREAFDIASHPRWAMATWRAGAPRFANLERYGGEGASAQSLASLMAAQSSARLDWRLLGEIRARWPRRLVVKGLLHPDDAVRARAIGCDGVIVSNHGGRQLDSAPAPIEMLPAFRAALGADFTIGLDGGARCGEDIAKALALGADFVLLGRAFLYAVGALGPERGPSETIEIVADELDRAQAQLGCPAYEDLRRAQTMRAPFDDQGDHV